MSIKYQITKIVDPDQIGDRKMIGSQELTEYLVTKCSVPREVIDQVLCALTEELSALLKDNDSVEIEDVDLVSLLINSGTAKTPEEVTKDQIKNVKGTFCPAIPFKEQLKKAKFKKGE